MPNPDGGPAEHSYFIRGQGPERSLFAGSSSECEKIYSGEEQVERSAVKSVVVALSARAFQVSED